MFFITPKPAIQPPITGINQALQKQFGETSYDFFLYLGQRREARLRVDRHQGHNQALEGRGVPTNHVAPSTTFVRLVQQEIQAVGIAKNSSRQRGEEERSTEQ